MQPGAGDRGEQIARAPGARRKKRIRNPDSPGGPKNQERQKRRNTPKTQPHGDGGVRGDARGRTGKTAPATDKPATPRNNNQKGRKTPIENHAGRAPRRRRQARRGARPTQKYHATEDVAPPEARLQTGRGQKTETKRARRPSEAALCPDSRPSVVVSGLTLTGPEAVPVFGHPEGRFRCGSSVTVETGQVFSDSGSKLTKNRL